MDKTEEYIDCSGMGILEVENKIKAFESRGNVAEMTVQSSDGGVWHSVWNLKDWKEFKDAVNLKSHAAITKVWIKEVSGDYFQKITESSDTLNIPSEIQNDFFIINQRILDAYKNGTINSASLEQLQDMLTSAVKQYCEGGYDNLYHVLENNKYFWDTINGQKIQEGVVLKAADTGKNYNEWIKQFAPDYDVSNLDAFIAGAEAAGCKAEDSDYESWIKQFAPNYDVSNEDAYDGGYDMASDFLRSTEPLKESENEIKFVVKQAIPDNQGFLTEDGTLTENDDDSELKNAKVFDTKKEAYEFAHKTYVPEFLDEQEWKQAWTMGDIRLVAIDNEIFGKGEAFKESENNYEEPTDPDCAYDWCMDFLFDEEVTKTMDPEYVTRVRNKCSDIGDNNDLTPSKGYFRKFASIMEENGFADKAAELRYYIDFIK